MEPRKCHLSAVFSAGRSLSTVVEKSIRQLKGGKVYHEPYNHITMTASIDATEDSGYRWERDPNRTHQDVTDAIAHDVAGEKYEFVFVKDGGARRAGENLKEGLLHPVWKHASIFFLIRHPYKVLASAYKVIYRRDENVIAGYYAKHILELYNFIQANLGYSPVIVDADDLERNPEATMRTICQAAGLKFDVSMMSWKGEPFVECHTPKYHHTIAASTGFKKKDKESIAYGRERNSTEGLPSWLIEMMDNDLPYYMHLYNRRVMIG